MTTLKLKSTNLGSLKYKNELESLAKKIYSNRTIVSPEFVVGFYRYWAKIDSIERALIKKGLLTKTDIEKEEIPILKAMKKDFK